MAKSDLTTLSDVAQLFKRAEEEMGKVIVGQKELLKSLQIALLADGHILLEGLPGLAKTLAVNTLAQVLACEFNRIQFTPDLLPADLIGTNVFNPKEGTFSIKQGPIFTNILLADEINRAPAKVQAALLEVMQERQVTISGTTFKTKSPYLVLATQNPVEHEGTYPLPEAQIDRFMLKVKISYPSQKEEAEILVRMATLGPKPKADSIISAEEILQARAMVNTIFLDPKISQYILDLVFATREPERYGLDLKNLIAYGASPRASIYLTIACKAHALLSGRDYVTPHDVKSMAFDVMRHRIKPTYEAEAEEVSSEEILRRILNQIAVP
jgi:MoxR-like ATPase